MRGDLKKKKFRKNIGCDEYQKKKRGKKKIMWGLRSTGLFFLLDSLCLYFLKFHVFFFYFCISLPPPLLPLTQCQGGPKGLYVKLSRNTARNKKEPQMPKIFCCKVDFEINVQMLEIYNEVLSDLLVDDENKNNNLAIQPTEKSGLNVLDAIQKSMECTEDVLEVMDIGSNSRAVGKMNDRSSRSHSVVTVVEAGTNRLTGVQTHGCLHLADLAGSKRITRSQPTGMIPIFVDMLWLPKAPTCLLEIATQLLQDSLSGQVKSMMFMHIAPEMSFGGETLSTAMLGARMLYLLLVSMTEKQRMEEELKSLREGAALFISHLPAKPFVLCTLNNWVSTTKATIPMPGPSSVLPQRCHVAQNKKRKTGALITIALEAAEFKETGRMAWFQLWPTFRSGCILEYNGRKEQRTWPNVGRLLPCRESMCGS
ncbi:hypothetical protein BSKO_09069 [Bryopsis sp. KO-2023]|nr:hypothetical protein BSKO_09069 [Bryopsis sp. KO-2023]